MNDQYELYCLMQANNKSDLTMQPRNDNGRICSCDDYMTMISGQQKVKSIKVSAKNG